ncbi:hypothetical protein [Thermus igniterrae]|uniref:hypothetical protein n=1 Tax=Thermus igniterrae TaxID=88189 RepID=UPI0003751118|nr:hypothetical protein [Thermus igniterrae]
MGPGFHRLYAQRLAWRYRLLLALGLALLGFLYPPLALLSPLGLLLPARLFEGQALRAIARASLAYPTALAYGEERLWREAERVRVALPPFPLGLLLAYLLALLLLLAVLAWAPPGSPWAPWGLPQAERPLTTQGAEGEDAKAPGEGERVPAQGSSEGEATPAPGEAPGTQATPKASEGPGKEAAETQEGTPREAPGPSPRANGQEAAPGREGASPSPGGAQGDGEGPEAKAPGSSGPAPEVGGKTPAPLPTPSRPGQGLLEPGQEGEAPGLPSPWAQGRPPEGVRRGVEVYLERTPLPPEARELLRRYFSGP